MATPVKKWLLRVAPWFLPVGIVAVWQLASSVGWLSTRILPSPEGVVMAFWTLSASGELWQHLAISSWRALIGFSIGGSLGLILGLISGLSRWGERLLDTSIQMLRNVPHLALIPLVILWFGIDESAKIFLVALGDAPRDKCALSCAINGIHAAFHYLKKNYISGCVMTVPTG